MKAFLGSCQKIANAQVIRPSLLLPPHLNKLILNTKGHDGQCITRAIILFEIVREAKLPARSYRR